MNKEYNVENLFIDLENEKSKAKKKIIILEYGKENHQLFVDFLTFVQFAYHEYIDFKLPKGPAIFAGDKDDSESFGESFKPNHFDYLKYFASKATSNDAQRKKEFKFRELTLSLNKTCQRILTEVKDKKLTAITKNFANDVFEPILELGGICNAKIPNTTTYTYKNEIQECIERLAR